MSLHLTRSIKIPNWAFSLSSTLLFEIVVIFTHWKNDDVRTEDKKKHILLWALGALYEKHIHVFNAIIILFVLFIVCIYRCYFLHIPFILSAILYKIYGTILLLCKRTKKKKNVFLLSLFHKTIHSMWFLVAVVISGSIQFIDFSIFFLFVEFCKFVALSHFIGISS